MAMMAGRVLLVCVLCVLWCGAAMVVVAEGSDGINEITDKLSRGSQSASQVGHAEDPKILKPNDGVSNTSENPLDAQELSNVSPQKVCVEQSSIFHGGMEVKEEKLEEKEPENAEPRRNGKEQSQDAPEGTRGRKGIMEAQGDPSPKTPAEEMPTSEEATGPAKEQTPGQEGETGQAAKPPQSLPATSPPASDRGQPGGSSGADRSVGGSKRGEGSNLKISASDGVNQSAVGSLGSGGGTGLDPNGGGGSSGGDGGSSRGDSLGSFLSAAGTSLSSALDTPSTQDTQSSEGVRHSEKMPLGTAVPNKQPKERSEPKAKQGTSTSEEAAESQDDSGDAVEKEKEKRDVGLKSTISPTPNTSNPPVTQTTPRASSAEPSPTTTEVQAVEETSKDNVTITKRNDTATPGDSDSSVAAFHTTSPLLLLLTVVVCAAAAALVAA
ncbi:Mucin-associated surface protein (MASP) [Trypanosoma cruzi]|uniref:Mucin-associated surface protein (MASP), putative n=2 Tax=Trypanosoma cruzi TaxID=5693 RepID=Q4D1Z9_TRYCC|nr:mucin-associated surface protein (MASP), putative [Trypanosoma cruzi]EAN86550.1 mucin-associated surface protein (MASP), putative [Trypanosoma cruzi]PWV02911.1 Mucin-associated surface protein (MASP) [Trypanosoma cruzi]|eukprot:XP_808401.1 mucin-associated surface protein (MASP) [Trypanosoma cruzi strain CL Brener]